MNDLRLRRELDKVGARYRRLLVRTGTAACALALAAAGGAVLARLRGAGYLVPAALLLVLVLVPLVVLPLLLAALRAVRDPAWIARRIERRFPDLDARLLAALEQRRDDEQASLGFLQETVVLEALEHANRHPWESLVSGGTLRVAKWGQWVAVAAVLAVALSIAADLRRHPRPGGMLAALSGRAPAVPWRAAAR